MKRSRAVRAYCMGALVLGGLVCAAPVLAAEAPPDDLALGAASLRRTSDRVATLIKEVPDRCAQRANATEVQNLGEYARAIMGEYLPVEVMIVQSTLLAADRVASDLAIDGSTLLKTKLQQVLGVAPADLDKLHTGKLAWSDVIMGLCLAKATDKKADELMAQAREGKTWPDLALAAGLKGGKLTEVMKTIMKGD